MRTSLIGFVLLALTGCATAGAQATYVNPETHDVEICRRGSFSFSTSGSPGVDLLMSPIIAAAVWRDHGNYASCKRDLESRGFQREGEESQGYAACFRSSATDEALKACLAGRR